MNSPSSNERFQCRPLEMPPRRERGVLLVVALTFVMMVVEIAVGYASHSMALLADGWHMATHVGALGITAAAYTIARRYAGHRAFTFGTGKVHALGGFASSLLLGVVALSMLVESGTRLFAPTPIDFDQSLPVAIVGLFVNLVSVVLLHQGDHDEPHASVCRSRDGKSIAHHTHDHGHRAAFLHVLADAFTSTLAIAALLLGRHFGWSWLDPATGVVGGAVILRWSVELARTTAAELLDFNAGQEMEDEIRAALEACDGVRLLDLHVWPMGNGRVSCVVTIQSANGRSVEEYRTKVLETVALDHLTIELRKG